MNTPTKNLKAKIQPNEGEAEDSVPYQNKNKVAQTSVGFLPNLSATIPQEGAPNIIPENGIKLVFDIKQASVYRSNKIYKFAFHQNKMMFNFTGNWWFVQTNLH